jgi:hypothetical protein
VEESQLVVGWANSLESLKLRLNFPSKLSLSSPNHFPTFSIPRPKLGTMQNQSIEGGKVAKGKLNTSKEIDTQTDLVGDEVEKWRDFYDKYLEKQLKVDGNLR